MKSVVTFLSLIMLSSLSSGAAIETQLLSDIKQANLRLKKIERTQLKDRQNISKELQSLELQVSKLKDKAAYTQSLADDSTLSIETIRSRLQQWRDQSNYQSYALNEYLAGKLDDRPSYSNAQLFNVLQETLDIQKGELATTWTKQDVIDLDGHIREAQVLTLGPVSWAYFEKTEQGGLLTQQSPAALALHVESSLSQQWQKTITTGQGILHLDPSLQRAAKIEQHKENLIQHVKKGGLWALPIILFGLIALLCALAKAWQIARLPRFVPEFGHRAKVAAKKNDKETLQTLTDASFGSQAQLLKICWQEPSTKLREDVLFGALQRNRMTLEKWLATITIIAAVSPLLGLLGTVSGMIETFKLMTIFGSGDADAVSSGISEALVTTELGLIVAIPAVLVHALLHRKVKQQTQSEETLAIEFSQLAFPTYNNEDSSHVTTS